MSTYTGPTLLTSRGITGSIPSSSPDQLSWNNDGQCLFVTRRSVQIFTPYTTTTLPPPPTLVDPHMSLEYMVTTVNKAKRKALAAQQEDIDMEDGDEPGPSTRAKVRRPRSGDIRWWSTTVEVDKEGEKDGVYGWSEIGDEYSSTLTEKEITVRGAVWSPSGMNDLGGSYLAVLSSTGQVSVYTPRSDPSSKQWIEICDLTMRTRNLLDRSHTDDSLSIRGSLEMRSTCMKWSDHLPSVPVPGDTGALLALANRAGLVALWSCDATRHFERAAYIQITSGWVSQLSWSPWIAIDANAYESKLAVACTDGSISILAVRQERTWQGKGPIWRTSTSGPHLLDRGDKRTITAIKWIDELLVWTKHGSVHLSEHGAKEGSTWDGIKTVRLERVGGWASANALGACIGIQPFGPDRLLITLASLTHHLINTISTEPTLLPIIEPLRLSVATRDCFLDFVYGETFREDRYRMVPKSDRDISAHGGGWAALDQDGLISSWVAEPINWHNLDSVTEGSRIIVFTVMDFGIAPGEGEERTVLEKLEGLLKQPPRLLSISPTRVLHPFFMRILAASDPKTYAQDLLDLCNAGDAAPTSQIAESDWNEPLRALMSAIWMSPSLDALRLRLVVARWASTVFPTLRAEFIAASREITKRIRGEVMAVILGWASRRVEEIKQAQNGHLRLRSRDRDFCRLLLSGGGDQEELTQILSALGSSGTEVPEVDGERCPACGATVSTSGVGSARCEKGHEWSRCSMTDFLVTTSNYRVCDTCPAISLFPRKHLNPPIAVIEGEDVDWKRFVTPEGVTEELVDELLEVAVVCVMCGGRWVRAM